MGVDTYQCEDSHECLFDYWVQCKICGETLGNENGRVRCKTLEALTRKKRKQNILKSKQKKILKKKELLQLKFSGIMNLLRSLLPKYTLIHLRKF